MKRDGWASWLITFGITCFAYFLRAVGLSSPHRLAFDETYYAKDAWSILLHGYERNWAENANDQILAGNIDQMLDTPSFVAHPPLGKLMIAAGEYLFGMNPLGWRFAALIAGSLLILFTIRLARRLSRSTMVGALAGILLTFDGLEFVMSRIALLDIFQALFAVAGLSALAADRDWFRGKLADHLRAKDLPDLGGAFGPLLLFRPWRIVAGLLFGASCAVKWNSIFVVAVFGILTVVWDLGARRLAGAHRPWKSLLIDAPFAFVQLVVVGLFVYLASWLPWLRTSGGWGRDYGAHHPEDRVVQWFGESLGSLWNYHVKIYEFHVGEHMMQTATHTYEAHPAGWLLMLRSTGIAAENGIEPGQQGCTAVGTTCLRVVSAMGTPILWWAAAVACVVALWLWIAKRDWRFSLPLLAIASTWLPWFRYADRPLFFFYAIMLVPFTVTVLAMVLVRFLGPADHPHRRRRAVIVGAIVGLIILNFAFFYPIYSDALLTRPQWLMRMWFGTWI